MTELDNLRALVLNAGYQPIETVSWQSAFTKILNGRAIAVDHYEHIIRSPSDEYFVPAVIVATEYTKMPNRAVIYSKRLVFERDNYTCQYCGKTLKRDCRPGDGGATIDHVIPRCKGGKSTFENTVTSCEPCNTKKAHRSLKKAGMKLRKKPRIPYIHPLKGRIKNIKKEWEPYLNPAII